MTRQEHVEPMLREILHSSDLGRIVLGYSEPRPMVLCWKITERKSDILLPLVFNGRYAYDCTIDWGDGTRPETIAGSPVYERVHHQYRPQHVGTTVRIEIRGSVPAFDCSYVADTQGLESIEWGDVGRLGTQHPTQGFFSGCTGLVRVEEPPDIRLVPSAAQMFAHAPKFNQAIGDWFVGDNCLTDTSRMFWGAKKFNQPLEEWNVASVTNMSSMFGEARAFSQPLGRWDTQGVTQMRGMFYRAMAFNQDLSGWHIQNVRDMDCMFQGAVSFDTDLNWVASPGTSTSMMFADRPSPMRDLAFQVAAA